jgi:predicted phage terminase large subunit-like protein
LISAHRFQLDLAQVRIRIEQLNQKYEPDLIIIDANGVGAGLYAELRNKGHSNLVKGPTKPSKEQRAYDTVAMIEGGRVSILANAPALAEFRNEIVSFPTGKHDDLVDTMTQLLRYPDAAVRLAQLHKKPARIGIKSTTGTTISITAIGI